MRLYGCPTPALPSLPTASLPLCGGSSIASLLLRLLNCVPSAHSWWCMADPAPCIAILSSAVLNVLRVKCDRSKRDSLILLSLSVTPSPPATCCAPYKALFSGWVCLKGSEG